MPILFQKSAENSLPSVSLLLDHSFEKWLDEIAGKIRSEKGIEPLFRMADLTGEDPAQVRSLSRPAGPACLSNLSLENGKALG